MLEVERVHDAFGPLYNGVFSARMPVKLQNSRCEALLTGRSEPIAVWSMLGGTPYPAVAMHKAWKELLKNQQHDGIGGCHVDRVTETMNERYRKVQDIGETVIKTSLSELAGRIDLSKLGEREIGLVIANTALVLPVTSRSLPLARLTAGILMISASELVAEGLPLISTVAVVAFALTSVLILASRPAGWLVNQLLTSESAVIALNLSFVSVIVTSVAVISVPVVPVMVTSATVAAGAVVSCTNLRTVLLLAESYSPL